MKGIKMIFGVLAAASLLFSVNAFAQENANRDENGKVVRGAYETNKAFDNTFIGIGAGINAGLNLQNKAGIPFAQGKGGFAIDVNFGKWWTPFIGGRINYHGLSNDVLGNGFGKTSQHFVTGDLLWSMTNTFGGYKETRFWNINAYISGGYARVDKDNEWVMGAGFLNTLRLSNRVNILIDLRAMVAKSATYKVAVEKTIGTWEFPLSATVGFGFNLGKTNFNRHSSITPVVIPVPFTTEQYNDLAKKVADLEKENAELKDKVAKLEKELAPFKNLVNGQTYLYENGTFTAVDVKPGAPITLYFDCGSAKLSAREKAHLEYFTENVVNENTKLSVNAYADKQTGTAKRNQQLSEQRAKTVVDLLKKAGANEANIECAAHGATVQLFNGAAKNRVVTVEVK
jgi:outer membrane protein OmpA-like peptidoglycan-associated protein